jgi:adenylate kinase
MNIVLLGIPGSGKGTQCDLLSKKLNIPQISTGQLLRDLLKTGTHHLATEIKSTMIAGQLVSDEIMIEILTDRIKQDDCKQGFLLDGFPRTMAQGKMLHDNEIRLDYVFELIVDEQEIVKRLHGRLIHRPSGRVYNINSNPPKAAGLDDVTGEPLIARLDDGADTVIHRMQVYRTQTEPLMHYYKTLCHNNDPLVGFAQKIIGNQPVKSLHRHLMGLIVI